jgi:hypothetical protein
VTRYVARANCAIWLSCCLAGSAQAAIGPLPGVGIQIRLETVASWEPTYPTFNPGSSTQSGDFELAPTEMHPLNDGTGRYIVSTLGGTIRVLNGSFTLLPSPLLTTTQVGLWLPQEAGMTGMAVHPDFANVGAFGYGKIYTIVTERFGAGAFDYGEAGTSGARHQDVIREWNLSSIVGNASANTLPGMTVADSREVLRVAQRGPFHNVADITFNSAADPDDPDYGQLYVTSGDGSPNGLVQRRFDAQNPGNAYGDILRINPNPAAHSLVHTSANTGLLAYSISPNNHFNADGNSATLAEVVAFGVRSPYRINFDRVTGVAYIGDVGDSRREEVSVMSTGGENFGWGHWEGTHEIDPTVPIFAGTTHKPPLFEYYNREPGQTTVGGTVVGGFVYRGSALPSLYGKYVFADFGNGDSNAAKLFYGIIDPLSADYGKFYELSLDPNGDVYPNGLPPNQVMEPMPNFLFSLAEGADGELYLLAGQDPRRSFVNDAFIIRLTQPMSLNGIEGDANQDGEVDQFDVEALVGGWLTTGHFGDFNKYAHGDFNLNGITDLLDVFILHQALSFGGGSGFPFELLNGTPSIPEPASIHLVVCALGGLAICVRCRQSTAFHYSLETN